MQTIAIQINKLIKIVYTYIGEARKLYKVVGFEITDIKLKSKKGTFLNNSLKYMSIMSIDIIRICLYLLFVATQL